MPKPTQSRCRTTRRSFLAGAGAVIAVPRALAQSAPAIVTSERMRPAMPSGVMTGDVTDRRAVLWSRTDRAARLIVEIAGDPSMKNARRLIGPAARAESDFAARIDLADLAPG